MAEKKDANWWGGWIATAKEKSWSAFEMAKKDVSEFVTTLQTDTTQIVSETADTLKNKLTVERNDETGIQKGKISPISENLDVRFDEGISATSDIVDVKYESKAVNRLQAKLVVLRENPLTYREEPTDGEFYQWQSAFNVDEYKGEISELLVDKPRVRGLYSKLVPSEMSHLIFWQRYFYKVHLLKLEDERRAKLLARANETEDEVGWGDDEDDSDGYSGSALDTENRIETTTALPEVSPRIDEKDTATTEGPEIEDACTKNVQVHDREPTEVPDTHEKDVEDPDNETTACNLESNDNIESIELAGTSENQKYSEDRASNIDNEDKISVGDNIEAKNESCSETEAVSPGSRDILPEDTDVCHEIVKSPVIDEKECDLSQPSDIDHTPAAVAQIQSISFNVDEENTGTVRISDEDLKDVNGKSSNDSKKGSSEDSTSDDWETEFDLDLENVEALENTPNADDIDNEDWDSWDEN
ncbi:BSD domain-containing protein 1 [Trichoplax sp. H2]|nr:BSD domain-containing protein 1 [Trichoplax sp. H2]|eukprot:RDD43282.1 BSD domain-containing protein 1 [Trichoplax sp. H2]